MILETILQVVTTLSDLRSIAEEIGGEQVHALNLAHGKQDPHFVDQKPTFLVKLRDAELFVLNGLDLEIGWVPPLLDGARNPNIIKGKPGFLDVSVHIPVLEVPKAETTRAEGDVHPFGNPHYLLDPVNGGIVARELAAKFKELRPDSAALFEQRLSSFLQRLYSALYGEELVQSVGVDKLERLSVQRELDEFMKQNPSLRGKLGGWASKLQPFRSHPVLCYHKSLSYLTTRFRFEIVDYVEPKPGIPPSAGHVAKLVEKIKERNVKAILTHGFYDTHVPNLLAEKTGVKVVVLPAGVDGHAEAKDYIQLFNVMVDQIYSAKP